MAEKKTAKSANTSNSKISKKSVAGVGAGVLAAAAGLAAGYYFYASKDAKKNRQIASKWAVDMKKDVMNKAAKVKKLDHKAMVAIVDQASKAYRGVRNLDSIEIDRAVKELKSNWRSMVSELQGASASVSRSAKKTVGSAKKSGARTVRSAQKSIARAKKSVNL